VGAPLKVKPVVVYIMLQAAVAAEGLVEEGDKATVKATARSTRKMTFLFIFIFFFLGKLII